MFSETTENDSEDKASWSIYLYLVGSDLESSKLNQLSKFTETMIKDEAESEKEKYDAMVADRIRTFTEEIYEQGMDLPNVLYDKAAYKEEEQKTVDPDATGYGTYNIETMINCEIPEGVQIIIETGGSKRWQTPLVNPNRSQRFLLDHNGFTELSNGPAVNMANPDHLEEFMVYCKEYFPAEHELMLFWDHGGGYSGFGIDEIFGDDMLTVREMTSALGEVSSLYTDGAPLFDIIGFDACLMGNLETARLFRDYADYYLASAEELSGLGWGYEKILAALYENPEISPLELGKTIADANVDNVQPEGFYGVFPALFSVIDLDKIEPVYAAYSDLMQEALKRSISDVDHLAHLSESAKKTLSYAYGDCGGFNLIDLYGFMENISDAFPEESEKVMTALEDCMLYTSSTSYFSESGGLSVFFPARMTGTVSIRKYLAYANEVSDNPDIDALFYYKIAGCLNDRLSEYVEKQGYGKPENLDYSVLSEIPSLPVEIDGEGNLEMTLPKKCRSLLQSATLGLVFVDSETMDLVYLSEVPWTKIMEDGRVQTDFDLVWPALEGNELPVTILSEDADRIYYRVPILYYDAEYFLMFYYEKASKTYTIAGVSINMDNGSGEADRTVISLEEGEEFSVLYDFGNLYSDVRDQVCVDYVYTEDLEIVDQRLSDGMYLEYLEFEDLRSDPYNSAIAVFEMSDGEILDQHIDEALISVEYNKKE